MFYKRREGGERLYSIGSKEEADVLVCLHLV
jgi:hypothetical protein